MNLLIVEDEIIINDYIYACLIDDELNIYRAYNGEEAINIIKNNKIDIILSDIIMDNKNGFDILTYLKEENYKIPTVMITALSDDDNLLKAYELGAVDYLVKPIKKKILKTKLTNLMSHIFNEEKKVEIKLNDNYTVDIRGESCELTKTEYDIFKLLYKNSPRIYTKENFIDLIWNGNYAMSEKVIEVNIFNIRKKLGPLSQKLKTKRGVGYYFEN